MLRPSQSDPLLHHRKLQHSSLKKSLCPRQNASFRSHAPYDLFLPCFFPPNFFPPLPFPIPRPVSQKNCYKRKNGQKIFFIFHTHLYVVRHTIYFFDTVEEKTRSLLRKERRSRSSHRSFPSRDSLEHSCHVCTPCIVREKKSVREREREKEIE